MDVLEFIMTGHIISRLNCTELEHIKSYPIFLTVKSNFSDGESFVVSPDDSIFASPNQEKAESLERM